MAVPLILSNLLIDKKKLFWFLHSLFWLTHWAFGVFVNPYITSSLNIFIQHIIDNALGFIFCLGLRHLFKKMSWYRFSLGILAILIMIYSVICGLLWEYSMHFTSILFQGSSTIFKLASLTYLTRRIWFLSYPFVAWSVMYFGYKFWEEWNEKRLLFEREQALAQRAQLAMLRYQLNPHFLFNTLSSLRGVMRSNIDQAENMITQISEFLRYSLLGEKTRNISFSKEIEIVKHYLDIEKVRFGEKLLINYEIDNLAEDYPIPVFLIHPLVENAVKHGMKTSLIPLQIRIKAEVKEDTLHIEVRNSGTWLDSSQALDSNNTGTGLSNTLKRLETLYPGKHTFEIIKDINFVIVKITIQGEPKEYGYENL